MKTIMQDCNLKPLTSIDQITRERIADLVISIGTLEQIAFTDETFLGMGYHPFKLSGMMELQHKTLLLNQAIRKVCGFEDT